MKNILVYTGLMLLAFCLQMCSDENKSARPGRVQFTWQPNEASNGRVKALPDVPDSMLLLYITIQNAAGNDVYFREEVQILRIGDSFTSAPIALLEGTYTITEFMVAYRGYNVLYATPLEGSPLASFVNDPLPITFSVTGDMVADLDVEVLSVRANETTSFGYATFNIVDAPYPQFQLAIFKPTDGGIVLSGAHVYIFAEADTVFNRYVPAAVNDILVDEFNLDIFYTLVIEEESYQTYTRTFMIGDILYETEGKPYAVTLRPADE
jgi:hypothetical protein